MLTREKQYELTTAWQDRQDVAARNRLVMAFEPQIEAFVWRYRNKTSDIEGLRTECYIRVTGCVDTFDTSRGLSFATYAKNFLLAAASAHFQKQKQFQRDVTVMDAPSSWITDTPMVDMLEDENAVDPEYSALVKRLYEKVDELPDKSAYIIRRMYLSDEEITFRDIAAEIGMTFQGVQQRKDKAIATLRKRMR